VPFMNSTTSWPLTISEMRLCVASVMVGSFCRLCGDGI
jgi:hypothetical protein